MKTSVAALLSALLWLGGMAPVAADYHYMAKGAGSGPVGTVWVLRLRGEAAVLRWVPLGGEPFCLRGRKVGRSIRWRKAPKSTPTKLVGHGRWLHLRGLPAIKAKKARKLLGGNPRAGFRGCPVWG